MTNDYTPRQAAHDREYQLAWESPGVKGWIESLPPEERKRLQAEGLLKPMIAKLGAGMSDQDLADSPLASEQVDIAALVDEPDMETAPTPQPDTADALASFCSRLCGVENPRMVFDAICYATGILSLEGRSATELAKRHGVTKQAFSKIAVQWCETFGLKPSRSMKSTEARETYRDRAAQHHHRRRKTNQQVDTKGRV